MSYSKKITVAALIAAIYVVLTIGLGNLAYGEIQFRASEVMVLLAVLNPFFILPVSLGTFIANLMGPFGFIDAITGSLATALSMTLIWQTSKLLGKKTIALFMASIWPVIINGLYVAGLIVAIDPGVGMVGFLPIAISVAMGEFVVVSIVGVFLFRTLIDKENIIKLFDLS